MACRGGGDGVDPLDARTRPLTLTDTGSRVADAMARAEAAAIPTWQGAAGPDDLTATARALQAYLDATAPPPATQLRRLRFT